METKDQLAAELVLIPISNPAGKALADRRATYVWYATVFECSLCFLPRLTDQKPFPKTV